MIYSVRGPLISCDMTSAVVECGGVGMKCFVSMNTRKKLAPIGTEVMLFTHLNVREDAMDLFGFIDPDELEMFRLITSVSGVGPKVALSILSEFEPSQLSLYIASGDSKSITRASGVGAKLAAAEALNALIVVHGVVNNGTPVSPAPVIATGTTVLLGMATLTFDGDAVTVS